MTDPELPAVPLAEAAAARAAERFEQTLARLAGYLAVPAISSAPAHAGDVERLAEGVAADLTALGFSAVVRRLPGALPLVAASRKGGRPGAPTLLIYGHLDLQPVVGEPWTSDPHVAVRRPSPTGERLYARGAADDMGGWVSHLAALEAWLDTAGELPLDVRLVLEGEEEIGSKNLERYMDAFPEDFAADAMVLTDCENPSVERAGLTTSLRGLYEVEVRCDALTSDVHSGLWGNAVPDVSSALIHLLARLTDADGRPTFCRVELAEEERAALAATPLADEVVRRGAHLLEEVAPLPAAGRPRAEWLWRQPALTVLSTTLPRPDAHKNALRASASAALSIRVPPGVTQAEVGAAVRALLTDSAPGGVRVSLIERPRPGASWLYDASGPVFDAVDRAYRRSFGLPPARIGLGGTIPFVALFARRFSHLPLILNGVMDPDTGAHGPDESLHLGLFAKVIAANVHLYAELATALAAQPKA